MLKMILERTVLLLSVLMLGACSLPAPKYSPSFDNVQMIKGVDKKVEVAQFKGANNNLGDITIRGNTLTSPYNKDFIHYIQTALELEFEKAGLLMKGSTKKLSAVIEENDIDTSDFSTAYGSITATFSINENGNQLYSNQISIKKQWENSFIGAVAIPKAAESYPGMVQELLKQLYSDNKFITALKK